MVCVRNVPLNGEDKGLTRTYRVVRFYTYAYLDTTDDQKVVDWPAFDVAPLKGGEPHQWSLSEMGVIPYPDGLWSTAHLTRGAC